MPTILTITAGKNYTMASGGFAGEEPFPFPSYSHISRLNAADAKNYTQGLPVGEFDMPLCNPDKNNETSFNVGGCYQKGHGEIRLLADAMARTGGNLAKKTLVINVNLIKDKGGTLSRLPCKNCHATMCKMMENCKFEIVICNNDNDDGKEEEVKMSAYCNGDVGKNRTELEDILHNMDRISEKLQDAVEITG